MSVFNFVPLSRLRNIKIFKTSAEKTTFCCFLRFVRKHLKVTNSVRNGDENWAASTQGFHYACANAGQSVRLPFIYSAFSLNLFFSYQIVAPLSKVCGIFLCVNKKIHIDEIKYAELQ